MFNRQLCLYLSLAVACLTIGFIVGYKINTDREDHRIPITIQTLVKPHINKPVVKAEKTEKLDYDDLIVERLKSSK